MPTRSDVIQSPPSQPVVFCDFDGTITQVDVTDQILSQFAHPSWQEIEQEWVRGVIGSRECLERELALVEASPEDLDALIDAVPVDPSFLNFCRFLKGRAIPLYVVSDGFDYVIRRVLQRSGVDGELRNGKHLFSSGLRVEGRRLHLSFPYMPAPCAHGCATCKAEIIRLVAPKQHPVIFIGDGLSDRFALEHANLVFAKRQLLALCREKGISCHPFETFHDIEAVLESELGPPPSARDGGGRVSR
jgi:2-hydroxy-3-keto-5-methylthiopentenyl-1-phosphate phosphatase